jgi:hypothetical protein
MAMIYEFGISRGAEKLKKLYSKNQVFWENTTIPQHFPTSPQIEKNIILPQFRSKILFSHNSAAKNCFFLGGKKCSYLNFQHFFVNCIFKIGLVGTSEASRTFSLSFYLY